MIKQKPWHEKLALSMTGIAQKARQKIVKWKETVFAPIKTFLGCAKRVNASVSSEKFLIPKPVVYFTAMFLFSFLVIALETIQFHMLLSVTNYLKGTFVISIAMLGIAIGSLLGFYLSKLKVQGVLFISATLLFFSIILSYYNIINIGAMTWPWFLILPFVFASIIVSSIFAHGNSNTVYFVNLTGSALGVLFPVIFLPIFKSETSLMLLMVIPVAFVFLQAFRIRNIPFKVTVAASSLAITVLLASSIASNVSTPDAIRNDIFETKIMTELDQDPASRDFNKNIPLEFFNRVYALDPVSENYVFAGDEYDSSRAKYLLQVMGFMSRWGIAQIPFLENRTIIENHLALGRVFYETELTPLLKIKYTTWFSRNYDLLFMTRAFSKGADGNYHMTGDAYDAKRARYLLTQLGHIQTIDLNFDVRFHETLAADAKLYTSSDRILYSEDSTLGRLEYTGNIAGGMEGVIPAIDSYFMFMNGIALDSIDAYNGTIRDPRVPWMDKSPRMFIVGLSADGIVKSCKRIEGARVAGIEINPGIMRTMNDNGAFAYAAGYPYKDVEVYSGEGRAFLENTPRTWDEIFLMNIHMEHGPVSTLAPEYFHTVEGTRLLLSKISDRGYVVYEEIITNPRSRLALLKMMNTIKTAMRETGVADPARCIYVYEWGFGPGSAEFRTIIIKRTNFELTEKKTLDAYMAAIKTGEPPTCFNVKMLHDPYHSVESYAEADASATQTRTNGSELIKFITGEIRRLVEFPAFIPAEDFQNIILRGISDPGDVSFLYRSFSYDRWNNVFRTRVVPETPGDGERLKRIFDQTGYPYQFDLSPATDNSPFPFKVYENNHETLRVLQIVFMLSLILIIPVFFLIVNKRGLYKMNLAIPNLFVAATGFGYMLVEIVLMQMFQRFIGLPTWALIITLGGLLFFSGIGSFTSRFLDRRIIIFLVALIPVILLFMALFLGPIFVLCAGASFEWKVVISFLLLIPISFLMGIPFPNALDKIRANTSGELGSLLFGVSGAFSTLGSASGFFINVAAGYNISFIVGIACYTLGLLLFWRLMRAPMPGTVSSSL